MLEKLIEYLKNLPEEEQKRLQEVLEEKSEPVEEQTEQVEESTKELQEESETTEQTEEQTEQEVENVEEKEEIDNEQVEEEQEQPVEQATEQPVQNTEESAEQIAAENPPAFQELLETKIELALIKAGIREDRIEAAKRLFKTEIDSLEDLDKLKELVKEFPEWQKVQKEQGASFGVPIKDSGNSLTEEEKKLKEMGIDPKN